MIRFLFALVLTGWATAALAGPLGETYARWDKLRNPDSDVIDFADGYGFLTEHPGWPEEKIIRLRTEAAALNTRPEKKRMEKFCADFPPISGRGMIACAMAGIGTQIQQTQWVKQGWLQGDFNADEEERIRQRYATLLNKSDHQARMDRLLYEGSTKAATRMLPLTDRAKHPLQKARIAFANGNPRSPHILASLSIHDRNTAGVIFDRLRWRANHDANADLVDLLLAAPKDAPYPELWWRYRALAARDAIGKGNYDRALSVLKNAGDIKGEALADLLWMRGWIHLRHKNDAATAYKEFFKLYTSVYTPVSKARAAYWAGRAAEKNGNKDIAQDWMEKAARYPTVFYGQLARQWLEPGKPLALPDTPVSDDEAEKKLASNELAQVARDLSKTDDHKTRDKFLSALANRTQSQEAMAGLADFAREIGTAATAVEISKLALRNGQVLLTYGWPMIDIPKDLPIEPALTLAITRQESEFDPLARSPADARGYMQLLPATARQMAQKLDLAYHDHEIDNPTINLTLGSHYLSRIINGFNGSYVLGIASYNAGPSNVRKWIQTRGMPPKDLEGAVDWIESIPFGETRNYVMRVLENVSVYRTLADSKTPLTLDNDIVR